jgi:hypothetical protein
MFIFYIKRDIINVAKFRWKVVILDHAISINKRHKIWFSDLSNV